MTERPLRVLLEANHVGDAPRGVGIYARQLGLALASRPDIGITWTSTQPLGAEQSFVRSPGMNPRRNEWPWMQWHVRKVIREQDIDVFHSTLITVPLRCAVPTVATVHDVTHRMLPRLQTHWNRRRADVMCLIATRADRIIMPTYAAAEDFLRHFDYDRKRLRVVYEAGRSGQVPSPAEDVAAISARLKLDRPYFLCVGAGDHQKRAIDAVRAVGAMRARGHDVQLVLAGRPGGTRARTRTVAARLGLGPDDAVVLAGYVSDTELNALYSGAVALLYPSLYEGFGIPPLEAMACGTPVIATAVPALREVLGEAATFVPFRDPRAIAEAAAAMLSAGGRREEFRGRGFERARRYSWHTAAAETNEIYRELV